MSGLWTQLGVMLGATGLVVGIVALLIAAEMSRRAARIIQIGMQDVEMKVLGKLSNQDEEISKHRKKLRHMSQDLDEALKKQTEGMAMIQEGMARLNDKFEASRNIARVRTVDKDEAEFVADAFQPDADKPVTS